MKATTLDSSATRQVAWCGGAIGEETYVGTIAMNVFDEQYE